MGDRALLEMAAKAAGINVHRGSGWQSDMLFLPTVGDGTITGVQWHPLADDGDALRLALACGISIKVTAHSITVGDSQAMKKTLADQGDAAGTKFTRRHHCHGASVVLIASHGGRCIDHC